MAEKKEKVTFVFSALDKFSAPFAHMGKAAGRMSAPFQRMGNQFKMMGKNLGLPLMGRALGRVRESFSCLGSSLVPVVGGVIDLGTALVMASKSMQQLEAQAASVGMSTDALLGYSHAVQSLGFDSEKVVALVKEMNNKIGESKGLGVTTPVKEAMQMLKLDIREIAKLKPEEQFKRIMNAAAGMKDQQMASSAVDILMGGDANKIMGSLRAQAAEQNTTVEKLLEKYRKMNLTTGEGRAGLKSFGDAWRDFATLASSAFSELLGLLGQELAPMLKKMGQWIQDNFESIRITFKKRLPSVLKSVCIAFIAIGKVLGKIFTLFSKLTKAIGAENTAFVAIAGMISVVVLPSIAALAAAFISLGAAIGFTPVGWIMMAFAGVVALAVLLYKKWDRVKELWKEYSNLLYLTPFGGFKILIDLVTRLWDKWEGMVASFRRGKNVLSGIGNAIKNFIGFGDEDAKNMEAARKSHAGGVDKYQSSDMVRRSREMTVNRNMRQTNDARVVVEVKAPQGTTMKTSGNADITGALNTGYMLAGAGL